MIDYIFCLVMALNMAAFLVSFILYLKEELKHSRYERIGNFIKQQELESLEKAV